MDDKGFISVEYVFSSASLLPVAFAGEKAEETPPHDPTSALTEEQIEANILKIMQNI